MAETDLALGQIRSIDEKSSNSLRRGRVERRGPRRPRGEDRKIGLHPAETIIGIQIAHQDPKASFRQGSSPVEVLGLFPRKERHRFQGSIDRMIVGRSPEENFFKPFADHDGGFVFLLDQHGHAPLLELGELLFRKGGFGNDFAKQFEETIQVLLEPLQVKGGGVPAGVGGKRRSEAVHFGGDPGRGALAGFPG